MSESVGGLYLQAKLQTDQVEAQIRHIATLYEKAMNPTSRGGGASGVTAGMKAAEKAAQVQAAASSRATQQVVKDQGKVAEAAEQSSRRQQRAARAAADTQVREAQRARGVMKVFTAGSQDLLVGLGAARSGNYFYGLAAAVRYAKNLSSALAAVNPVAAAVAIGVGVVTVAALAAGAAFAGIAYEAARFGVEQAANFQMLNLQLEGLLGNAQAAQREFTFLTELGKESIVPTQSLIAADRQLLAFGVTAENTRHKLVQFFSDFGTATGANEQQVYYLSLALSQVAAIGHANTIDMRQLANAGINTMAIYKIVGAQIGMSARQVAAHVKDGIITSERLFAAVEKYGKTFQSTAEKARNSTLGLWANIQDIVTTQMGKAFKGLNEQVAAVLRNVQDIVERINFDNLASSVQSFITSVHDALGTLNIEQNTVVDLFSVKLPVAIAATGVVIGNVIKYMQLAMGVIKLLALTFQLSIAEGASFAIQTLVAVATVGNNVLDALNIISDEQGQANRDAMAAMQYAAAKNLADVKADVASTVDWIAEVWGREITMNLRIAGPGTGARIYATGSAVANKWAAFYGNHPKPQNDTNPNPDPTGSSGTSPAMQAAQAWVQKYQGLIKEASDARQKFLDVVRRPFGTDSEVEQSLNSGSTSSIVSMYDTLNEALTKMYAPLEDSALAGAKAAAKAHAQHKKITAAMQQDFQTLVNLAKANDQIANEAMPALDDWFDKENERIHKQLSDLEDWRSQREEAITTLYDSLLESANAALDAATSRYEEANNKLQALIEERDSFLSGVRDSLRSYVNDLSSVDTEIQKYTRLDPVGSFLVESVKQAADFKTALATRLDAVKAWQANIRALIARGVDSSLVKDFVSKGLDSAGVVAQLAGADNSTISQVNAMQGELTAITDSFSKDVSAAWFDAGVAQAEAYVAPLRSAMESAQAEVTRLETERKNALAVLKASYEEQKKLGEQQLADLKANYDAQKAALQAQMDANTAAAKAVADRIQAQFTALSKGAVAQGVSVMQGLIDGLNDADKQKELVAAARQVANLIRAEIADALKIRSPSRVAHYLGSMVSAGLASGMDSGTRDVAAAASRLATVTMPSLGGSRVAAGPVGSFRASEADAVVAAAGRVPSTLVKVLLSEERFAEIARVEIEHADEAALNYVTGGSRL